MIDITMNFYLLPLLIKLLYFCPVETPNETINFRIKRRYHYNITRKGPVTRCNFSCNLQRYSTLGRCTIGKYTFPSQFANIFLTYQTFVTNLHLLRVELRCKLPGKLHRVTGP